MRVTCDCCTSMQVLRVYCLLILAFLGAVSALPTSAGWLQNVPREKPTHAVPDDTRVRSSDLKLPNIHRAKRRTPSARVRK